MRPLTLKDITLLLVRDRLTNKISTDQFERRLYSMKKSYGTSEVLRTIGDVLSENFKTVTLGQLFRL